MKKSILVLCLFCIVDIGLREGIDGTIIVIPACLPGDVNEDGMDKFIGDDFGGIFFEIVVK